MPALELSKRACYEDQNGTLYGNCYTAWDSWARWVVLAVIIVAFFLLFVICSCITARRRRRQGLHPYRGTGWAAGNHGPVQYNAQPYYQQQPNQYQQPAPPYSPPAPGYYSQQTGTDVPMQPQPAYARGGDDVYSPPEGPPPAKGDGVIR